MYYAFTIEEVNQAEEKSPTTRCYTSYITRPKHDINEYSSLLMIFQE